MTGTTTLVASAASSKALWYLTRSTGLVALILLTATVVVGVVASVGWTTDRWPRFLSQSIHRNLSLFCLAFVGVHVVTTVSDGFVPIGFAAAFIPFQTAYRPLYVSLGALTLDLMLAVLVTSALRRRIGFASWRFVHWLSYLCWPIAMVHGLGSGSDTTQSVVVFVDVLCMAAVAGVVVWRLATGRTFPVGRRAAAGIGAAAMALVIVVFAMAGPLRPGWSRRAGTSSALLSELARKTAAANASGTSSTTTTTSGSSGSGSSGSGSSASGPVPSAPFSVGVAGSQSDSTLGNGDVQVTLTMHLQNSSSTPLTVVLTGTAAQGGGVAMSSGTVTFGPDSGQVTSLNGGTIGATVNASTPLQLVISLNVDQNTGALSGTVNGSTGSGGGRDR